jgi:hypothetical protein
LTDFLPLDRAALEQAVDRFFERLEDRGAGVLGSPEMLTVVPGSAAMVAALAVVASELAHWRLHRRAFGVAATGSYPEEPSPYSGLPDWPGPRPEGLR